MKFINIAILLNISFSIVYGQKFIADYTVAKEKVLRAIPKEYIHKARNSLHVAYQHTSHGTHVSRGLFGLPDYKTGDDTTFAITNKNPIQNKLSFHDLVIAAYAAEGENAADLSRNETAFIQATRNYLDDPANAEINVVLWSWCNIANHDVSNNYLPGMDSLINEYSVYGTKVGSEAGQRENPVTFVFMTGHANTGANIGEGKPKNQADLINAHCTANHQYCLDYYSIDTHDMDDNYWEDAGDNGQSTLYGGNFYEDYQESHVLNEHFYENKIAPGGDIAFGAHNTQHITANRKAYAMWWILARIAGWDGSPEVEQDTQAPTTPAHLICSNISVNEIHLEWDSSEDNVGVTAYKIYRNDAEIGNTSELNYRDKGLIPAATYKYHVTAIDAAGNESQASNVVTATTLSDMDPPSVPENLSAVTISSQQINLNWSRSTDNQGVEGYTVFRNGAEIANITDTLYSDVGLEADTPYEYQVLAYDFSRN